MYRYLIITTSLAEEKEGTPCNFDKALTDAFVKEHLQPAVALAIATKRRLAQRRTWRLDPCIPYTDIRTTLECVVDGAWGSLSGLACLCYLIQRYTFMGTPRVSVYLFSLSTAMNSLTELGHQVDAEISGFQIGTKETVKALKTLKELNVRLEHGPILISDSQTVLSLCSRPSSTLDLSTSLVV